MIRIKFKPEVKIKAAKRVNFCSEFKSLGADVLYSKQYEWQEYTIAPSAIESWSIYHPITTHEMKAEYSYYLSGKIQENDVFYPIENYNERWAENELLKIINAQDLKSKTETQIFGSNVNNHLKEQSSFPGMNILMKIS